MLQKGLKRGLRKEVLFSPLIGNRTLFFPCGFLIHGLQNFFKIPLHCRWAAFCISGSTKHIAGIIGNNNCGITVHAIFVGKFSVLYHNIFRRRIGTGKISFIKNEFPIQIFDHVFLGQNLFIQFDAPSAPIRACKQQKYNMGFLDCLAVSRAFS